MMAMTFVHTLLAVFVMMTWGFNFVAAKVAVTALPPIFLMALRFATAGILLAPFVKRPRGRQWLRVAGAAVTLGTLHFCLMFTGLKGLDASTTAIAVQIQVPFAALLASIFFKERLGWRGFAGMAVGLAGIVLLAGEPHSAGNLGSLGLVLLASFVWALSNIQIKSFREPVDGLTLTAWLSLFATPLLLIVSSVLESGQLIALKAATPLVWASTLYMAVIVTIVGFGIWCFLLSRYPINQMMAYTLLVPVFGVMSGVMFMDDPLSWRLVGGGIATIAGVAVIILRRPSMVVGSSGRTQR